MDGAEPRQKKPPTQLLCSFDLPLALSFEFTAVIVWSSFPTFNTGLSSQVQISISRSLCGLFVLVKLGISN